MKMPDASKLHTIALFLALTAWWLLKANVNGIPPNVDIVATSPPPTPIQPPVVDNSLKKAIVYFRGQIDGAEAVIADDKGRLYSGVTSGDLVQLNFDTNTTTKVAKVGLRPLGLAYHPIMNKIIVADAVEGLLAVDPDTKQITKLLTEVNGQRLMTTNNIAISKTGEIYFSDATRIFPQQRLDGTYETFLRAALTCALGDKYGRVYKFDPVTKETTVLIQGLIYANGVALSKDEDYLVVAETCMYRVHRIWLKGPKAGTSEIFADGLPGFVDNINSASDGGFWVAIPTPPSPLLPIVSPHAWLKRLLISVPASMIPKPNKAGIVVKLSSNGDVAKFLYDPDGSVVFEVTDAFEYNGKLYLSSVKNKWVATLDLE